MHKVTLPTLSKNPPLPEIAMAVWPMHSGMKVMPPPPINLTNLTNLNVPLNYEHFIDYNQPLMRSIETLKHNEKHYVKKPAGILNSIAVPLLTYSSSLEHGTIFAAAEPTNIDFSILPKLNTQNSTNKTKGFQKILENNHNIINDRASFSINTNSAGGNVVQEIYSNEPTNAVSKAPVQILTNILVKPGTSLLKSSYDKKNTQIMKHSNKKPEMKFTITSIHELLNKSQTNKKLPMFQYKPNKKFKKPNNPEPKTKNTFSSPTTTNTCAIPSTSNTFAIPTVDSDTINTEEQYTTADTTKKCVETVQTIPEVAECPPPEDDDYIWPVRTDGRYTNTELVFEPYTEHYTNVMPESPLAHIGDNKIEEYGLPLTKCVATVFGGTVNVNKTPLVNIDVTRPLMKCLKILKYVDVPNTK